MKLTEDEYLMHYGILRKSGRYPWGSGNTQTARNRSFLDTIAELKRQGMTDAEIAKGFHTPEHPFTSSQLRAAKTIAVAEQKQDQIRQAQRLKDRGWSNVAIGERMGLNESSVRSLLLPGAADKAAVLDATADMLKRQVEEKGMIDIGTGVEAQINLSPEKLAAAVAVLQEQGYAKHSVKVQQLGTGKETTLKVLAPPGTTQKDVFLNRSDIRQINEHTIDSGRSFLGLRPPLAVSPKRVEVRYAEDGGSKADGVIYLRPGAKDLSMGKSSYAQVRIQVGDKHFLKGMAMYKDDLPDGVDIMFNTNKSNTGKKTDAMKELKPDIDNPFGATIKPNGQRGALNIINEEGDWSGWSKNFSSQFLSKQNPKLAESQLRMTQERRKKELDEILALTNPAVRKKLLDSYADDADSAAVHLRAAALPKTSNHVLLPIKSMKEGEIYAPNFTDGTRVALVRHPHGGVFEIPELTVNNRNREAMRSLGKLADDAVGIHHKVAERLSGADFDGDTVLVIPNNRGEIKTSPALSGLKGFDPQTYKIPTGSPVQPISERRKQLEMGNVSNLITDMTIMGAPHRELARAIRHSMVVIDAEKHKLDYRASARDNGISQLKAKYQGGARAGSATLISRASSQARVMERKDRPASLGGAVDKATGKKQYVETGGTYTRVDKDGNRTVVRKTTKSKKLAETDDAHTLVSKSGTPIERVYADHSNRLKAMANEARKASVSTKGTPMSKSAKAAYSTQVGSLNSKLAIAKRNAPLERQAQLLANATVHAKRQANPEMDSATLKKIKYQALEEARIRTGAKKQRIYIEQQEWDAIQAGAISNHKLEQILSNADPDRVKALATPRVPTVMTSAKQARAKALLGSGATQAEVAKALGVSLTTLKDYLSEGG